MQQWSYQVLGDDSPSFQNFMPRQFEFHPSENYAHTLLCGTLQGDIYVLQTDQNALLRKYSGGYCADQRGDAILGLCWLKKSPTRFIAGSAKGKLSVGDIAFESDTILPRQSSSAPRSRSIVRTYEEFDKLTSVHVNSSGEYLLTSGYVHSARVYDVETASVVTNFENVHTEHINISRFANQSPFLFATSSFDKTCKMWDLRMDNRTPVYSLESQNGLVMVCFSPDDNFLLASAVDNEIAQYLTVDGRRHLTFAIPKTSLEGNFTRAYYSASGTYVLSGSSDESCINISHSSTGELLTRTCMYPGRKHSSLYVQSLRGNPFDERHLCVLANYRDLPVREIISLKIGSSFDFYETSKATKKYKPAYDVELETLAYPSPVLRRQLHELLKSATHADLHLRVGVRVFPCHMCIIMARCDVLKQRVLEAFCPDIQQLESQMQTLDITDICAEPYVFEIVLRYIYTDDISIAQLRSFCDTRTNRRINHSQPPVQLSEYNEDNWMYLFENSAYETQLCWTDPREDYEEQYWYGGHGYSPARRMVALLYLVFTVAHGLGLDRLCSVLDSVCAQTVMTHTVMDIYGMARNLGRQNLLNMCVRFIACHWEFVCTAFGRESIPRLIQTRVEQLYMRCLSNLPTAEHSDPVDDVAAIPNLIGHKAVSVCGNLIISLGGRNIEQYHSLKSIYVCATINDDNGSLTIQNPDAVKQKRDRTNYITWRRLDTKGAAPQHIMYHTACTMEKELARHVIVCGGRKIFQSQARNDVCSELYILDTMSMAWYVPMVAGNGPRMRLRHTMVGLYHEDIQDLFTAEELAEARVANNSEEIDVADVQAELECDDKPTNDEASVVAIPDTIIWDESNLINDEPRCHIHMNNESLRVLTSPQPQIQIPHWFVQLKPPRVLGSTGSTPTSPRSLQGSPRHSNYRASISGRELEIRSGFKSNREPNTVRDRGPQEFRSFYTMFPEEDCAVDVALNTRFVVFGGMCDRQRLATNEVHTLVHCGWVSTNPNSRSMYSNPNFSFRPRRHQAVVGASEAAVHKFAWVESDISGEIPSARFGHASVLFKFPLSEGGPRMVSFGGNTGQGETLADVCSLQISQLHRYVWERVAVVGTPPLSRCFHTMTAIPQARIQRAVVIGGSVQQTRILSDVYVLEVESASPTSLQVRWEKLANMPGPSRELHISVCVNSKIYVFGGNHSRDREPQAGCNVDRMKAVSILDCSNLQTRRWRWVEDSRERMLAASTESILLRPSPTLTTDLAKLLTDASLSCTCSDVKFETTEASSPRSSLRMRRSSSTDSSFVDEDQFGQTGAWTCLPSSVFAHKALLTSRSEALKAMFEGGMREASTNVVRLQQVNTQVFMSLLNYLYTDRLECNPDLLIELLLLANKYNLALLVKRCEGQLCLALEPNNCVSLLQYSELCGLQVLRVAALTCIIKHWAQLAQAGKLRQLPDALLQSVEDYRTKTRHSFSLNHSNSGADLAEWFVVREQAKSG